MTASNQYGQLPVTFLALILEDFFFVGLVMVVDMLTTFHVATSNWFWGKNFSNQNSCLFGLGCFFVGQLMKDIAVEFHANKRISEKNGGTHTDIFSGLKCIQMRR